MWLAADEKHAPENVAMHVCLPQDGSVKLGQTARIMVKWLKDNPEKLHWRGETVVLLALLLGIAMQAQVAAIRPSL